MKTEDVFVLSGRQLDSSNMLEQYARKLYGDPENEATKETFPLSYFLGY